MPTTTTSESMIVRREGQVKYVGSEDEIGLLPLLKHTRSATSLQRGQQDNLGLLRTSVHLSTLDHSVKLKTAVLVDWGEGIDSSLTNESGGVDSWGEL